MLFKTVVVACSDKKQEMEHEHEFLGSEETFNGLVGTGINPVYAKTLAKWTDLPVPERRFLFGQPILFPKTHLKWWGYLVLLGLPDRIASSVKNSEDQDELAQSYLDLLINLGVIGALIFSVLFPIVVTDYEIPERSSKFFTDDGALALKYMFLTLVNAAVALSMVVIYRSAVYYKHLCFWMANTSMKKRWMEKNSVGETCASAQAVMIAAIASTPFGAASAISPLAGLLSLLAVGLFSFKALGTWMVEEDTAFMLHQEMKDLAAKQQQQQQQQEEEPRQAEHLR